MKLKRYHLFSLMISLLCGLYIYTPFSPWDHVNWRSNFNILILISGILELIFLLLLAYIFFLIQMLMARALIKTMKVSVVLLFGILLNYAAIFAFIYKINGPLAEHWVHCGKGAEIKSGFILSTFDFYLNYLNCTYSRMPVDECLCEVFEMIGYHFHFFFLSTIALVVFGVYLFRIARRNKSNLQVSL